MEFVLELIGDHYIDAENYHVQSVARPVNRWLKFLLDKIFNNQKVVLLLSLCHFVIDLSAMVASSQTPE